MTSNDKRLAEQLVKQLRRFTYLEVDTSDQLAESMAVVIRDYIQAALREVDLKKYCISMAVESRCEDVVARAKEIEEYLREDKL